MSKIKIIADSTCDLSKELVDKYNITVIPLCVVMGDKSYYDGVEVTPDEIYVWADANKTTPKTINEQSAVNGEKAAPAPTNVATPLPPLNLK